MNSKKALYLSFTHKLLIKSLHIYVNYEDGGMWNYIFLQHMCSLVGT
jgi:hypothetical protein